MGRGICAEIAVFHLIVEINQTMRALHSLAPNDIERDIGGKFAAGKAYTFGYLSTKIEMRMHCYVSIAGWFA